MILHGHSSKETLDEFDDTIVREAEKKWKGPERDPPQPVHKKRSRVELLALPMFTELLQDLMKETGETRPSGRKQTVLDQRVEDLLATTTTSGLSCWSGKMYRIQIPHGRGNLNECYDEQTAKRVCAKSSDC